MNSNFSHKLRLFSFSIVAVLFAAMPLSSYALTTPAVSLPSVSVIPSTSAMNSSGGGSSGSSSSQTLTTTAQLRGVCLMLSSTKTNIDNRINAAESKYQKDAGARINKIVAAEAQAKTQDNAARKVSDAKFNAYIASLSKKATTDVQKEAVRVFASRVREATNTRRSSVDAASLSYISGVRALINAKQDTVLGIAQHLQTEMQQQFDAAKASCESGSDPKIVRNSLKSSLDTTQSSYTSKLQDQSGVQAGMASLAGERSLAVADANRVFAQELAKASQDLSAVVH